MSDKKSINIAGFKHQNPIPNAARIGNLVMSGLVVGVDEATHKLPADLETQIANMFAHVRSIVEQAGGTMKDVIKMNVWLKDASNREALNKAWVQVFPDEADRPARQTLPLAGDSAALVQCDVTAVLR